MLQVKLNIAERTRTLEIIGLSVSLTALILSLAIFCRFRLVPLAPNMWKMTQIDCKFFKL